MQLRRNKYNQKIVTTKILKYRISKKYIVWLGIILVVLFIGYILLNYYDNYFNIQILVNNALTDKEKYNYNEYINYLNVGESFIVLFLSVVASSIITYFIGTKENNSIYSDLITNDVFASKDFYDELSDNNKDSILKNLEQQKYFNGSKAKTEMYSHIKDSLNISLNDGYYYNKCKYDINCTVYDTYIEKRILKTVEVYPIDNSYTMKKYLIASSKHINNSLLTVFELKNVRIDGSVVPDKYIKQNYKALSAFDKMKGYDEFIEIYCEKNIDLSIKKSHKIEVEYITQVPISDKVYTCRLRHACKSYSFIFRVESKNGNSYSVNPSAFGFVDDASKSPNHIDDKLSANIEFDGWMFPHDGVSIFLSQD